MLVLAGSGQQGYEKQMRAHAAALGLDGAVLWTGLLDGLDKLSAMSAATIFVLPSYSENFGIALVEALAAGLPCVVTENVAASEFVREHEAGIIIRAEVSALSSALDRLLNDTNMRILFAKNARRFGSKQLSSEGFGVKLRRFYEQIISEQKKLA
jgi:glycosyltransferase involved in cell wall biosynthesis